MRDNNITSYEMHLNLTARIKKWNGMERVSSEDFISVARLILRELVLDGYSPLIDGSVTVWDLFCRRYSLEDMDFFPRAYTIEYESENHMLSPMEAYGWVELAALIAYGKDPEFYIRDMKQYFGRNMEPTRARRNGMDQNLERLDVWVRSERLKKAGAGQAASAARMQEEYGQQRRKTEEMLRSAEQEAQQIVQHARLQAETIIERGGFEAAKTTAHARKIGRERLDTEQRAASLREQKNISEALLETGKTLAGVHEALRGIEKQVTDSFIQRISMQLMELYDLAMDSFESLSGQEEMPVGESLLDLAEVVAQDLTEYGIEPIITDPGSPYNGALHEAVGKEQFDPRNVIVQRSLRFGFRRETVVLRREKVTVTDPAAARRTQEEPEAQNPAGNVNDQESAGYAGGTYDQESAEHIGGADDQESAGYAGGTYDQESAGHAGGADDQESAGNTGSADDQESAGNTGSADDQNGAGNTGSRDDRRNAETPDDEGEM